MGENVKVGRMRLAAAGLALGLACASTAQGQIVNQSIQLNYNWNGMVHTGEGGQPDASDTAGAGYRAIADRGLLLDGTTTTPASFGVVPIVGATGMPYSIQTQANVLDMIFLGNRSISTAFDTAPAPDGPLGPNRGVQPLWLPNPDLTGPQTTTISPPITLDGFSEIGVLYHITNLGAATNTFLVTLGFTDSTSVTVSMTGRDWFGTRAAVTPSATSGISSITQRGTYRGSNDTDNGTLTAAAASNTLNVFEGIIDAQRLAAAGAPGSVAGKELSSITFQYPQPTGTVNKAYGIFAATVRTGVPANATCSGAAIIAPGDTSVVLNARSGGQAPSACGNADSTALWYSFTPAGNDVIEARTCGAGIDTTLSVYTSCGGAAVVCNDNGCGSASRVQWQGVAGQNYLIRVGGNNAASGTVNLSLTAPANTDIPMPLEFNFNGMCHGPLEQSTTTPPNDNRANPIGYRAIADRGFLVDGSSTSLNFGGTIGFTGIPYQIHPTPLTRDMVALGDRNFVANGARAFLPAIITGNNNGIQPSWLPSADLTGPQSSGMGALGAVMGTQTAVGLLYHITDSGGRFDVTLTFTDATSVSATVAAPDWFGGTAVVPAALPGVAIQRRLGTTYNSVRDTDNANLAAANERLGVIEGVVTRDSLLSATGFDISGRTLASIVFSNPISNNTTAIGTPAQRSGVGIFAATLRNPASVSLNFNPSGSGTATPALVRVGGTTKLTVQTTPGTGTPNTVTGVTLDASSIGLGSSLAMFDNGTNGDVVANDGIFTRDLAFPVDSTPGTITLPFTVTDAQSRTGAGTIFFAIVAPAGSISPSPAIAGQEATVSVTLAPSVSGPTDIASVVVSSPGVIAPTNLSDSGLFPDLVLNDGIWTGTVQIAADASGGQVLVDIAATDVSSRIGAGSFSAAIVGPPVATSLGTLAAGSTLNTTAQLSPGGIVWFTFTLDAPIDAGALTFLDIDTEGSSLTGTNLPNDTMVGLYTSTGARVAFDDDDGSDNFSQLTFGLASPARPAPGNGAAYNGRDGATLAAGTYFVAVSAFTSTFNATNWSVTTTSAGTGTLNLRIASGTFASSGGVPTTFTDLGSIGTAPATATAAIGAGEVRWFKFTLDDGIDAASRTFLDIDTEGSTLGDTIVGLFRDDGAGTFVASDDNDGSGTLSQLAYGRAARAPVGDGLAYNGRDGATLAAGTYYLAVAQPTVAFGNNFVVAFNTGTGSGDVRVNIRRGTMPENVFYGPVVNPANGSTYYLLVQGLSWPAARDAGIALGGNLTTIDDADENEWVRLNVNRFDGVNRRCFIGYTDELQEGVFVWADGSTSTYTNWGAGEPNNGGTSGTPENYVELFGDGSWNDIFATGASVGGSFSIVEIPGGCPADFNNSGTRDVADIFAFLSAWFANAPGSDFNNSGARDVADIFAFLSAWFAGCP